MYCSSNEVNMNLLQVVKEYLNEEVCLQRFVDYRLQRGITFGTNNQLRGDQGAKFGRGCDFRRLEGEGWTG